ncbi:MAG: hypothetical protein KF789_04220 [Bdellovibrionaceae bacterium]|nr:hypothetical protein [Pseudobdellovibrionaceae bacterium]
MLAVSDTCLVTRLHSQARANPKLASSMASLPISETPGGFAVLMQFFELTGDFGRVV